MAARRRTSFVQIAKNPLEAGRGAIDRTAVPAFENLVDSTPISLEELDGLIGTLKAMP